MKYNQIKVQAGRAWPVNPIDKPTEKDFYVRHSDGWNYGDYINQQRKDFETWLSTQPEIHTSAPDGVYNVDEFEPVKTQILTRVRRLPGFDWVSLEYLATPEITLEMLIDECNKKGTETRQWLELKPAVESEANCNGCGKEILSGEVYFTVHNGDDYCKDCTEAIQSDDESSGRLPAIPEKKGVEQGEEKKVHSSKWREFKRVILPILKSNGFKYIERNSYANDSCNVVFENDKLTVANNSGQQLFGDVCKYWLVGVLYCHSLTETNVKL